MPDDMLFDEQERQDKPSASHKDSNNGDRSNKRGKPRAPWLRWKALTIGNQIMVIATTAIAFANILYAVLANLQLQEIRSGSGRIPYKDVFDRQHLTTFCGFLRTDLETVTACNGYNEAD